MTDLTPNRKPRARRDEPPESGEDSMHIWEAPRTQG